jgi:hypothetical protein
MPRFYFHVKRGRVIVLDHDGLELANAEAAAKEAALRGRKIAAAEALRGAAPTGMAIVVADERWWPVFEVPCDNATDR